jgi:hypothetical protein
MLDNDAAARQLAMIFGGQRCIDHGGGSYSNNRSDCADLSDVGFCSEIETTLKIVRVPCDRCIFANGKGNCDR